MSPLTPPVREMAREEAGDAARPFAAWSRDLKRLWYDANRAKTARELRFLHILGLLANLLCLPLDAEAGVFAQSAPLRLGVILPAYLIAITVLGHARPAVRQAAAIVPVVIFAAAASYFGTLAPDPFADRYVMAAILLILISIVVMPIGFAPSVALATGGLLAIVAPPMIATGVIFDDISLFAAIACLLPLIIKRRSEQMKHANFLLTLQSRQAQDDLLANNRELEQLSTIDPLTGLLNRRGFEQRFDRAFEGLAATDDSLGLILLDIDHFKPFNDSYGHQIGDACLRQIGRYLKSQIDPADGIVGRYGGEEFIAALFGCSSAKAGETSERLRRGIARMAFEAGGEACPQVTASVGYSVKPARLTGMDRLIRRADEALYAAKETGRDRVVDYDDIRAS